MLSGYRTYITAALAVLGALAAWLMGDISLEAMVAAVVPAILSVFVRAGIKNDVAAMAAPPKE